MYVHQTFGDLIEGARTLTVSLGGIRTVTLTMAGGRSIQADTFYVDSEDVDALCGALQEAKKAVVEHSALCQDGRGEERTSREGAPRSNKGNDILNAVGTVRYYRKGGDR